MHRQDSFVTVHGKRLRTVILRHRDQGWQVRKPVLVFLHEGLGCVELWGGFPQALAEATGLDALIYDRQGYGGSSPLTGPRTPEYLHEEALTWLPAVLVATGIERPLPVGHSDGGTIALLYAAHCDGVPACIVEAAHVFVEEETLAGIRDADAAYSTTDLPQRLARYHGDKTETMFRAWVDTWLSPAFRDWNIEAELAGIRAPVLAAQGEDDQYGTPAQVDSIVRNTGGPAEPCMIPRCGHTPHREAREVTRAAMTGFLDRHL